MPRYLHYLFMFIFLLAACSPEPKELAVEPSGFIFSVNPQKQTVTVEAVSGVSLSVQQTGEPRILVPGAELSLENYFYSFAPGNILKISALVRNKTPDLVFEQPFSFSVAPGTSNIVRSTEPTVTPRYHLGPDDALTPGEVSGRYVAYAYDLEPFYFEVEHKNEPFSYFVNASAVVKKITTNCDDPATVVTLQSESLQAAIRSSLGLTSEPLTCARMLDLKVLEAPGEFVLEGLQFATNLEELIIPGSHQSYQPIADLTSLTHLDISNANVPRLGEPPSLNKLVNLTHLDMSYFSYYYGLFAGDVAITAWPNLTHFNLSNSQSGLPDLSNLTELTRLEARNLSGAPFGPPSLNLNVLSNLSKLTYLDLDQSASLEGYGGALVSGDLNALSNLSSLTYLDLSATFKNPAPLANLSNLIYLGLRRNNYDDISALLNNTGLADAEEEIDLTLNCLYSSEALEHIQTLEARNPNVQNVFYEPQADFCN